MRKRIILISHCFLNDAAKLKNQPVKEQAEERRKKRTLLGDLIKSGIDMIQLPCPEFYLYGSERWGHAASQFDHPFYRQEVRRMLEPILLQVESYLERPDRFEILAVIGIDGSPSCGVHDTYDGDWGGEFCGPVPVQETIDTLKREEKPGVFMEVLRTMLKERGICLPFYSLDSFEESLREQA